MSSTFDTNFWIQFVAGIVVVSGGIFGVLRWVTNRIVELAKDKSGVDGFKSTLEEVARKLDSVENRLGQVEAQYRKNSGSSMRDAVDRIEEGQRLIRADVLRIDKAVERHLGAHEGLD